MTLRQSGVVVFHKVLNGKDLVGDSGSATLHFPGQEFPLWVNTFLNEVK